MHIIFYVNAAADDLAPCSTKHLLPSTDHQFGGLVQGRRNSIVKALELRFFLH